MNFNSQSSVCEAESGWMDGFQANCNWHGGLQLHVRAYLPADTIRRCWLLLLRFIDRVAI